MQPPRPSGMTAFTVVWAGQVVSLIGSAMTRFALAIWAWEITGQATALALVGFFAFAPEVLFSPLAGALVDRWNRKLVMMLSDLAAGLASVAIFLLYLSGHLQVWHLWAAGAFAGAFAAFQWPAYSAAISTMIPKEHYARASGMMSLADSGSGILAPALAGALIGLLGGATRGGALNGISAILIIDVATFLVAIAALLLVAVPQPPRTEPVAAGAAGLGSDMAFGFRYVLARPSLLGLQLVFFGGNLMTAIGFTLFAPMVLARTGSNSVLLGTVQSVGAVGGVIGAAALSAWGGPRRKVDGVLFGWAGIGLCQFTMGLGLPFWYLSNFGAHLAIPSVDGSNQSIWQAKVPPQVQGRVFSARRVVAQVTVPLGLLLSGPLADRVFEPAMKPGGALAGAFGWLVGTGSGAGMALLMMLTGAFVVLVGLLAQAVPAVRNAESLLPDHEEVAKAV
nr:MFS transporter [Chloroflexota bacterium]